MFRVAWWLLVALACYAAIATALSALGVPYLGPIAEGLIFYGVLYGVMVAFARYHLCDSWLDLVPLRGVAPRLSIPVVLASLGALVLSYEALAFCLAISVVSPEALSAASGGGPFADSVSDPSFAKALVSTTVLPAVFEEALMRGLVLQALMQSMSRRRAVVISALFFAVAHGAIERMPGTFLLGLLYGWMFVRTGSLLPGMIAHALHNGTVLVLYRARMMPGAERSLIPTDVYGLLPAWMVGAAVALVVAGMMLVPKTRLWPEDPGWKSPEEIEEESYDAAA